MLKMVRVLSWKLSHSSGLWRPTSSPVTYSALEDVRIQFTYILLCSILGKNCASTTHTLGFWVTTWWMVIIDGGRNAPFW